MFAVEYYNAYRKKHMHTQRDMVCAKTMRIDSKLSKLVSHDSRLTLSMTYRRQGKIIIVAVRWPQMSCCSSRTNHQAKQYRGNAFTCGRYI